MMTLEAIFETPKGTHDRLFLSITLILRDISQYPLGPDDISVSYSDNDLMTKKGRTVVDPALL